MTVHDAPTARVLQSEDVAVNSVAFAKLSSITTPVTVSGAVPVLVTVIVRSAEAVPVITGPNATAGPIFADGTPPTVPSSATVASAAPGASETMVSVAERAPITAGVGENVTRAVQEADGASVVQLLVAVNCDDGSFVVTPVTTRGAVPTLVTVIGLASADVRGCERQRVGRQIDRRRQCGRGRGGRDIVEGVALAGVRVVSRRRTGGSPRSTVCLTSPSPAGATPTRSLTVMLPSAIVDDGVLPPDRVRR